MRMTMGDNGDNPYHPTNAQDELSEFDNSEDDDENNRSLINDDASGMKR